MFSEVSAAEEIRRSFAAAWGEIGAAWGIAPSTAAVQGYLLAHGGPLTEPEVRRALGISHRAASLALGECAEWGLIERAAAPRRSGQRGPAAAAWVVVGDHWSWFRRVALTRKEREMDPAVDAIERCAAMAAEAARQAADDTAAVDLRDRLAGLLDFARRFDRGIAIFVEGQPVSIERLFEVLDRLDAGTVTRLWSLVDELKAEELTEALTALSRLSPAATRRLIGLADQPALRMLLGIR
jgi:DNA-binding transcriptional regulator GbsR (MarR family)